MADPQDDGADRGWRLPLGDQIDALIARIDWVSQIGSRATRALAVAAWIGAVGCWLTVYRGWGVAGWLLFGLTLIPGATLWSYARALDAAVDATRIEAGIASVIEGTGAKVADIGAAFRQERFRLVKASFRTLQAVRGIREEISNLGIDVVNWAQVANPVFLAAVGIAAASAAAMLGIAVVAGLLRLAF